MKIEGKKNPDLIIFENKDGSCNIFVRNTQQDIFLSKVEFDIFNMLDGNCDSEKIKELYPNYNDEKIKRLLQLFHKKKLLDYDKDNISKRNKLGTLVLFHIPTLPKSNKNLFINNKIVIIIFYLFIISGCLGAFDFGIKTVHSFEIYNIFNLNIINLFIYSLIIVISIFCHEIGHTLMITYAGAYVVEYTVGLNGFLPCIRTVYIGMRNVSNLNNRILITMYGIAVNLFLVFLSDILLKVFVSEYIFFVALFNLLMAVVNFMVVFDTDGLQLLFLLIDVKKSSNQNNFFKKYYLMIYIYSIINLFLVSKTKLNFNMYHLKYVWGLILIFSMLLPVTDKSVLLSQKCKQCFYISSPIIVLLTGFILKETLILETKFINIYVSKILTTIIYFSMISIFIITACVMCYISGSIRKYFRKEE